jgi:adenylosuccinate synthase
MTPPRSRLVVVVGGQYGSEGKGAVCAALARDAGQLTAVRTAGPNAGHTVYDRHDKKWVFRQVPVTAVIRPDAQLMIAAGSEVHLDTLAAEVADCDAAGHDVSSRLYVDQSATILTREHIEREGDYGGPMTRRIGSTGKGVGACRADRIMRVADLYGGVHDTGWLLRDQYEAGGRTILIEGSQGFALGSHEEHYPYCTSRDCRAIDELAAVGILPLEPPEIWVVLRTYPIRVADPPGGGTSGDLLDETSWEELGQRSGGYIQQEFTSVTLQRRRVGEWDAELAARAVEANGGDHCRIALTMFDYWYPELAGASSVADLSEQHLERIWSLADEIGAPVAMVGTGPHSQIRLPIPATVDA